MQHISITCSSCKTETSYSLNTNSPSPCIALGNCLSTFCFYYFDYFKHFMWVESYICPLAFLQISSVVFQWLIQFGSLWILTSIRKINNHPWEIRQYKKISNTEQIFHIQFRKSLNHILWNADLTNKIVFRWGLHEPKW